MTSQPHIIALIPAAGRGTRAASDNAEKPKQYQPLPDGAPVLRHTLQAFANHPAITAILPIIHANDRPLYEAAAQGLAKLLPPVTGDATRQDSVRCGLLALEDSQDAPPDYILVHDGARPFVSARLISDIIAALETHAAAVPVVPVVDTIRQIETDGQHVSDGRTLDRARLRHSQTPQGFHFPLLLRAHIQAAKNEQTASDDAALLEEQEAKAKIAFIAGEDANVKLTTQADMVRRTLSTLRNLNHYETHIASGFDVHAFAPEAEADIMLTLGGVDVPHTHRLVAHSDGDVVLHALTDALLGTIAAGDIGDHFPPSEPAHKNRNSADFLSFAADCLRQQDGRIIHMDATIICERPKIAPHKGAMQTRIATICNIAPRRVSIKATTTEGLGALGRQQGIAVQATASVALPIQPEE